MIVDPRTGKPPAKDAHTSMVHKLVDEPPAYSDHRSVAGQYLPPVHHNFDPGNPASATPNPPPSADQVHIFDRKHDIQGTFFIDPLVPDLNRRKKHKSKHPLPHASFRSRHGAIDLELATTGNIQDAPKANVAVSSRSGDIKIKLLPMPPSRPRMGLDVNSHHGNVVLFLPEGFAGVVHLTTRKGDMQVLPALSAFIKIVKSSNREMIFMIGTQNNVYELDNSREASFCEVNSRRGNIVIGLSGRDHYSPQVGFWKRLGSYLMPRGESSGPVKDEKLERHCH
ncbi:hypothetical protein GALMADRAFT_222262 [Galerina marginata CBS 339.88]|uniref:DUF7330 domain-containing protein n=1 Tax=Galerina marginata (strain CBS 339.88) TaxID=685588 RepID=A0A067TBY4_GALM3|nr:hypothetical protein GALMADRAFT_222262 [Galerina marginata CBS 339.88]